MSVQGKEPLRAVDGLTMLARVRVRVTNDPVGAARAALAARRLAPATPTPDAVLYLHRALVAVGAVDVARQVRDDTDWRTSSPETWAHEQALEAAASSDPRALDAAIEELHKLPASPERDAALMVWLGARGLHPEALALRTSADSVGPRLYRAAGLERDAAAMAGFCSQARTGPPRLLEKEAREYRAEFAKDMRDGANSTSLALSAMFKMCLGNNSGAIQELQKSFKRDQLPWTFALLQLWFESLAGRPEYDHLVARWAESRNKARVAVMAAMANATAVPP
jgi:hypothetical protein